MLINMVTGQKKVFNGAIGEKKPESFPVTYGAPEGYDGWSELTIDAPDNLEASNIKKGVVIAGITGSYDRKLADVYVDVNDVEFEMEVEGIEDVFHVPIPEGYDGMKTATIRNLLKTSTLRPKNIKKGVTIMGYEGTYEGESSAGIKFGADGTVSSPTVLTADMFEGTTTLKDSCFSRWSALTSITIPDSVTSLGMDCFYNCTSLTSITIPDSVTSLGMDCFYNCTSLTSITIPDSVTSLGDSCFRECSSLQSITIPDSVTSLGAYCFYYCTSLTSITIPDGVTSLGDYCFYYCKSLASVEIGEGVTSMAVYCLANCSVLKTVTMKPTTPPSLMGNSFSLSPDDMVIRVPEASLEAYKAATNWSAYADQMVGY